MKRNVFWCIANVKRSCFLALAAIFVVLAIITPGIVLSQSKTYTYTVVIDAGHGGLDVK